MQAAVDRLLTNSSAKLVFGAVFFEGGVEGAFCHGKIKATDKGGGLGCAVFAVHAGVLPFHRERSGVWNVVQRANDGFEIERTAAGGAEIPKAAGVAELSVTAKDAGFSGRF